MKLSDLSPYHAFAPRPTDLAERDEQAAFCFDRQSDFAVCLGGNGSGKTHAAAWKTARHVRETPPHRPGCPFWIVGEFLEQVCKVAWVEKLSKLIPAEWILHIDWYRSRRSWPRAVVLRDRRRGRPDQPGWTLEFKSYEQGIDAFKAASIGGFWCNEEVPLEIVDELRARCREYNSPGWADFTPIKVKSPEWVERYLDPPDGWRFYHLNTLCNHTLPEEWRRNYFASMAHETRQVRQHGDFVAASGAVLPEFRKSIHVVDPYEIPEDWPRMRGIDFGFANPFVCLWVAKDYDGRYVVFDEHYRSNCLNTEHAAAINSRPWGEFAPWGRTWSDHDAQQRAELASLGIDCTPANKDIRQSIDCLRSLLIVQPDGRPRLTIFRSCAKLIEEIPGWRWPAGTSIRNPAEQPVDRDNHAIDALRYAVFSDWKNAGGFEAKGWRVQVDGRRHGVQFQRRLSAR